jgi:hypothetical protein
VQFSIAAPPGRLQAAHSPARWCINRLHVGPAATRLAQSLPVCPISPQAERLATVSVVDVVGVELVARSVVEAVVAGPAISLSDGRSDRKQQPRVVQQSLRQLASSGERDAAWAQFYASRAQRAKASAIRSQERRRLRSSARVIAVRRFAGIAARRASTARLSLKRLHQRDELKLGRRRQCLGDVPAIESTAEAHARRALRWHEQMSHVS